MQEAEIPPQEFDPLAQDGQQVTLVGRLHVAEDQPHYRLLDAGGEPLAELRPGPGVDLAPFDGRVVRLCGTLHPQQPFPLLVVYSARNLYQVRLAPSSDGVPPEEYPAATIGYDPADESSLHNQVQTRPSALVVAETLPKSEALRLPLGRSDWLFLDCYAPRFDSARFDRAVFPGKVCLDRGVFDLSRFNLSPPEIERVVFTSVHDLPDPQVAVRFEMVRYQPGAFQVRLPADLPERFGGRFNQSRFGQGAGKPQVFVQAVTEPPEDDVYIVESINRGSSLVEAQIVPRVPLGWTPLQLPFRQPSYLTLGDEHNQAQIFLQEQGIPGFLRLQAREPGDYGNRIAVAARASGPAMYNFSVIYEGVPFETARKFVLGKALETLTEQSLKPGPGGLLQAKAAGVHVRVLRERTPEVDDL